MLYSDITELIGNTPLLRLDPGKHGIEGVELYAKLEFCNPFGSVKDRIAWGMIRDDLPGITSRGQMLIEASREHREGPAGPGRHARNPALGAHQPDEGPGGAGCPGTAGRRAGGTAWPVGVPDPTVPNDVFGVIEKLMAENPGAYYHTSQYTSQRNLATHHDTTGKEIFDDIGPVDFLFGGLGTTGSTRGAATYLRAVNPRLQTIGIVSTRDDFIPGIRSEAELWEVGLFERDFYAEIVPVRSADAVNAAVDLARPGMECWAGPPAEPPTGGRGSISSACRPRAAPRGGRS